MLKYIFAIFFLLFSGFISSGKAIEYEDTIQGFRFDRNQRSVRIPARISNKLAVIPIQINDSPPLLFILDTGVNTTILTEPAIASFFDFPVDEKVYVLGLGNEGIIEAGMSKGLTFNMRGITGHNMNLIIIPEGVLTFSEYFGFPVHGIIGNDLFSQFPVKINYRTNTIRIYREPTYRIRRRSHIIPLELENSKPYIDVFIEGDSDTRQDTLQLLVDMGATNPVFLNSSYKGLTEQRIPAFLGKGISGELEGEMGRLQKITIGEIEIKEPLVAYPANDFMETSNISFQWEGILGAGILSRFHVIIDYPSSRLLLRKNLDFKKDFHSNLSGMDIIAKGMKFNEFVVNHVRKNSVAFEAGIKKGDKLLSVNRNPLTGMNIDEVVGLFNQSPGTILHLQLQRDNKIYRQTIRLREDI
ncbi:MAG: aspartyl protease family protein [Bacteroidales bacterium]